MKDSEPKKAAIIAAFLYGENILNLIYPICIYFITVNMKYSLYFPAVINSFRCIMNYYLPPIY